MARTLASNSFGGGMVPDPRDPRENVCRLSCHFDIFTYPHKLTPYRSYINGDTNAAVDQIVKFAYTNNTLYGLGVVSGTGKAEVFSKTDFTATTWLTPANNQSSAGTKDNNVFVYYDSTNKIYGLRAGTQVWSFDVAGGAWVDSVQAISYTNTAPGLVHSKDDILYIPTDNKINTFNGSSWVVPALTLPSNLIIVSICEYNNYLAIGCKSKDSSQRSKVFLWDRNSSLATISETIDWGDGALEVLEEVEGSLIGISLKAGSTGGTDRLIFRQYSASMGAVKFNEIIGSSAGGTLSQSKQKVNNRLLFMASITLQGTLRQGVWSVGRPEPGTQFAVVLDHFLRNTPTATDSISGDFFLVNNIFHITYSDNGTMAMSMTDSVANYSCTSIYETVINPEQPERYRASAGIRSSKKQALAALLGTEALPSGASAVLKYRVDAGSFTTWGTNSTLNSVAIELSQFDAAGTAVSSGREYEFHIESTGGAEITELKYKVEVNESLL